MKTKLLCIGCLLLAACGKSAQENTAPPTSNAPAKPGINVAEVLKESAQQPAQAPGHGAPLSVLGLHLGMDIHDVPGAMMEILAERQLSNLGFTEVIHTGGGTQCVLMYTKSFLAAIQGRMEERYGKASAASRTDNELLTACIHADGVLAVKADAGKDVSSIEFSNVKELFDAKDMTPAEFAQKLADELHLPAFTPDASRSAWIYASPDGDRLEVSSKDVLGIPRLWLRLSR